MAYTKETLMAKVTSKYPDIVDVELVKTKENTTVKYKCGHSDTVALNNLLRRGTKAICRICAPAKNTKKTNEQFLEEVDKLNSDIVFLEEYINSKTLIKFKYKSCGHEHTVTPNRLLSQGTGLICKTCNPPNQKTHKQFLEEVFVLTSDLEFLEEYKSAHHPMKVRYKSCGHEHNVIPNNFSKGHNLVCRTCNPARLKSNEQFLEEVAVLADDIEFLEKYIDSKTPIHLRYRSCRHEHEVTPNQLLSQGIGLICRICNPINTKSNKLFLEEVAKLTSDIQFLEEYKGTDTHISFRYKSCGHEHKVTPNSLLSQKIGLICRICTPANKKSDKQFLEEVATLTTDIEVFTEYKGTHFPMKFKYKSCGHEHKVTPSNLLSKGTSLICRICNPIRTSKGERAIAELLSKYTKVETSNRTILEEKEIDIYLPEFKIGIEYNGEYWHSEDKKGRNYHLDKTKLAESKGIRLVHIFEHEWLQKQDIVKSRLLGMLQQNYKLGARLCTIRELTFSDIRSFLDENHLQGAGSSSSINLGLYHKDDLVAVMTFSKPRFNSNYDYELIRYASLTGINVQGGASKLLKYFTRNYKGSIISYSDKRWSSGNLYKTLGFEYSHTSEPNYFYAKNNEILSRYKCQKHKLKELLPDFYKDELTETEIMTNAGFNKVFDCGNDVWIMPDRRADG